MASSFLLFMKYVIHTIPILSDALHIYLNVVSPGKYHQFNCNIAKVFYPVHEEAQNTPEVLNALKSIKPGKMAFNLIVNIF